MNEVDDVCAGYMGVTKLWSTVEPVCESVSFFHAATGQTIGEDASCWLHALAATKPGEAALGMLANPPDYSIILRLFSSRLQRVLDAGIKPFFVFDGVRPGAKAMTDEARSIERKTAADAARALMTAGDRTQAAKHAIKAVHIKDELVYLIVHKILRPKGIGKPSLL